MIIILYKKIYKYKIRFFDNIYKYKYINFILLLLNIVYYFKYKNIIFVLYIIIYITLIHYLIFVILYTNYSINSYLYSTIVFNLNNVKNIIKFDF